MRDPSLSIERDQPVAAGEIAALWQAVGWDRCEPSQVRVLRGSERYYTIRDGNRLIGFLNVISDGVADAMLVNVIVHPDLQRRGLGQALVRRAVSDLTADGIQCIQVTFLPEREGFYRKCGFFILGGGVIDSAAPNCGVVTDSDEYAVPQAAIHASGARSGAHPAGRE